MYDIDPRKSLICYLNSWKCKSSHIKDNKRLREDGTISVCI